MNARTLSLVLLTVLILLSNPLQQCGGQLMPNLNQMIASSVCNDFGHTTSAIADAYVVLLKIGNHKDQAVQLQAMADAYDARYTSVVQQQGSYVANQAGTNLLAEGNTEFLGVATLIQEKVLNDSQKRSLLRIARNVAISVSKDEWAISTIQRVQAQRALRPDMPEYVAAKELAARGPQQLARARSLRSALLLMMQKNDMPSDDVKNVQRTDGMQWGKTCYWTLGKPEPCDGDLSD